MVNNVLEQLTPDARLSRRKPVYNFGAGPAMLPGPVMEQAQSELLNWQGTGMSVMEISHRSEEFVAIAEQAESDLRKLLAIPDNYHVLFLQGGASSQFAMVPMNLATTDSTADYLYTGSWSGKALKEAARFCRVNTAASTEDSGFTTLPMAGDWQTSPEAAYLYYCDNETINGVEFGFIPEAGNVPLVSDMTSNILSRPLDVSRFGIIFAGAQKNIGPAGLVIVIVREDLVGRAGKKIPSLYDYAIQSREASMYNTPPTFAWYMAGLVFQWTLEEGGVGEMQARAGWRSSQIYRCIDSSDFYSNNIDESCRSRLNVPFRLADESLNGKFLDESRKQGLLALRGHRSVGGMRASLYNAMPRAGVDKLVEFMGYFEKRYG